MLQVSFVMLIPCSVQRGGVGPAKFDYTWYFRRNQGLRNQTRPGLRHSPLAQATDELTKAYNLTSKSSTSKRTRTDCIYCPPLLGWEFSVMAIGYLIKTAKFKFLPRKKYFVRTWTVATNAVSGLSLLAVTDYQVSTAGIRATPST
jgi:hypothetical protein